MPIQPETIGERIKSIRKAQGLSQNELGALVGVSGTAIMRYEKGEREPKIQLFRDIAKALRVSEGYLLLMTDDPTPKCDFVSTAFALGVDEYLYNLHQPKQSQRENAERDIPSQEEINRQIAEAEQEHTAYLEKICFDPTMPEEDYPSRIRYVTLFIEKNSDTLKLAMPGTHMAPDDIEESKKIRAAGGTPDSSE